jgi:hypothetical protein
MIPIPKEGKTKKGGEESLKDPVTIGGMEN